MDASAPALELDDHVFDPQPDPLNCYQGFLNYAAFDPSYDLYYSQQAAQDFASTFSADPELQHVQPTSSDPAFGDLTLPELEAAPQYPDELDLQEDLTGDFNFSDINLPQDATTWLDSQFGFGSHHDTFEFLEPAAENVNSTVTVPALKAVDLVDVDRPFHPPVTAASTFCAEVDVVGQPSQVPSEKEADGALETYKRFIQSRCAEPSVQSRELLLLEELKETRRAAKKRKRSSPGPPGPNHESNVGRASIPPAARRVLEDQFEVNPYVSADAAAKLSLHTGLSTKTIKTWFANARSRRKDTVGESQCPRRRKAIVSCTQRDYAHGILHRSLVASFASTRFSLRVRYKFKDTGTLFGSAS